MREVQDHYFRQAKAEGYVSRAAYKLLEINERKKTLHKGDRVLDCGAAPGSWLQVAAKIVGPKGIVIGIDLQPIRALPGLSNVRTMQGDFTAVEPDELLKLTGDASRLFDVIISDMAPNTSGDPSGDHHRSVRLCQSLLDRASKLLRDGGNLVMKVFEGEAYPDLVQRSASMFESARGYKPKASRSESAEMYIIASGLKVAAARHAEHASQSLPRQRPSSGWANS